MATENLAYDTWTTMTWGMTNPSSDSSLLIGRESTVVDNTSNLFLDALVGGTLTGPTSGAAAGVIEIYCYAAAWGNTDYTAECTGSDAALTLVVETKRLLKLVTRVVTNTTNSEVYEWGPFSVAHLFGGVLPPKWGLWGTHNAGGALNAATTKYLGIERTVA